MRYEEFRDALAEALGAAGLRIHPVRVRETLDLGSTSRRWKAFVDLGVSRPSEPYYVSAAVSFVWDPVASARTHTTEEDLLSELFGGHEDLPETLPRHQRIDMTLQANLLHGSRTPLPTANRWRSWSRSVDERLAGLLPQPVPMHDGRPIIVMGWRGTVEVESVCSDDGDLLLRAVTVRSWHAVVPPRARDAVDDHPEGDIGGQLDALAERYRGAFEEWAGCVADLGRKIRYRPPGP